MDEIKILVCDKDEQARDNLRKVIQFDPILNVKGLAKSAEESMEVARELSPDIALMGLYLDDMDGIEAAQRLQKISPFIQIILLAQDLDYELMRKAMKYGINDVINWPVNPDELHAKIHAAAARQSKIVEKLSRPLDDRNQVSEEPSNPVGKVLAVYSAKGGAGCTFIATNLAVQLHSPETPVALVDGDLQFGDVPIFLNQQVNISIGDLDSHLEEFDGEILLESLLHYETGMKVLAAPLSPELADNISGDDFAKILEHLQRHFAYVVVDTSSALNDVTVTILEHADLILTIAMPDISSIRNTRSFLEVLASLGIPWDKVLLILNGIGKKDAINAQAVSDNLRIDISSEIPFDRETILRSINRGEPLILGHQSNLISKELLKISDEVKLRVVEEDLEV